MPLLVRGLWYSVTILAILGCHELGHYLACRYYDVDASLPFFLPAPLPLTGTLGAFIRMRSGTLQPFQNARVGLAGPLWGTFAAAACWVVAGAGGGPMWAAIAYMGAWLKLLHAERRRRAEGGH